MSEIPTCPVLGCTAPICEPNIVYTCDDHYSDFKRWFREIQEQAAQAGDEGTVARLRAILGEVFDYTKRLESASSPWFLTRSYAKWPEVDPTLGDRIQAALVYESAVTGDEGTARLREALEFYADPGTWDDGVDQDDPEDYGEFQHSPDAYEDAGQRARTALAHEPAAAGEPTA